MTKKKTSKKSFKNKKWVKKWLNIMDLESTIFFGVILLIILAFFIHRWITPKANTPSWAEYKAAYNSWKRPESFPIPGKIFYGRGGKQYTLDLWSMDSYEMDVPDGEVISLSPASGRFLVVRGDSLFIEPGEVSVEVGYIPDSAFGLADGVFVLYGKGRHIVTENDSVIAFNGDRIWGEGDLLFHSKGDVIHLIKDYVDTLASFKGDVELFGDDRVIVFDGQKVSVEDLSGNVLDTMSIDEQMTLVMADPLGRLGTYAVFSEVEKVYPFFRKTFYYTTLYRGTEELFVFPTVTNDFEVDFTFTKDDSTFYIELDEGRMRAAKGARYSPWVAIDTMDVFYGWTQ